MSIKRKKIREQVDSIKFCDLTGSFDRVISALEIRKNHLKYIYPDCKIWIENNNYEFLDERELGIFIERLENHKEYNSRVKKLMKNKDKKVKTKKKI
jgi:gluconate kinase